MSVPHPIPYQGSKRRLAQAIVAYLPGDTRKLLEPFAGSAAVSIAAAYAGKTNSFVLNDINSPLMELWRNIINQPTLITAQYRTLWETGLKSGIDYYNQIRSDFNRTHQPHYLLYLLTRCVKAAIRYNANGDFNQSPDNRRNGTNPNTLAQHIYKASLLFKGNVSISAIDYQEVLEIADVADVVYMDPPYQGVSNNRDPRYVKGLSFDAFVESLKKLNNKNISYIVSYDGRTGSKVYGLRLPESLQLECMELDAGRSSQATLLGKEHRTYESLYLSPALTQRLHQQLSTAKYEL